MRISFATYIALSHDISIENKKIITYNYVYINSYIIRLFICIYIHII